MHKLRRGEAPACLSRYRHGLNNWGDVSALDKERIWAELEAMQGHRCAYCEGAISVSARHIEHFRQKSRDNKQTFMWPNLFGSCNRQDSCGNHKDRLPHYDPADLIKPDDDDPDVFLLFVSDGSVIPRPGLNDVARRRALETIRIFNLNGALRQIRYSTVAQYIDSADAVRQMVESGECSLADCPGFFQQELTMTAAAPFSTAIRHVLLPT